jgi:hypothetical protein
MGQDWIVLNLDRGWRRHIGKLGEGFLEVISSLHTTLRKPMKLPEEWNRSPSLDPKAAEIREAFNK